MQNNKISINSRKWDSYYESHGGVQYPHEQLVIYVSYLKQKQSNGVLRALEMGFGAIPDLVMLYQKGYEVHGLEVSENAVKKGRIMAEHLNVPVQLELWSPYDIPYNNEHFDLFCSSNSFHFNLDQDAILREVHRILNNQGRFYITYLAPGHLYLNTADLIEDDLVRFTEMHPVPNMRNMVMRFYDDPRKLESLYKKYFRDVRVSLLQYNILDKPNAYWIVTGGK